MNATCTPAAIDGVSVVEVYNVNGSSFVPLAEALRGFLTHNSFPFSGRLGQSFATWLSRKSGRPCARRIPQYLHGTDSKGFGFRERGTSVRIITLG